MKKKAVIMTVLWMGLIFYFSHQPADISNKQSGIIVDMVKKVVNSVSADNGFEIDSLTTIIRKMAHFSIYACLGFLTYMSVFLEEHREVVRKNAVWIALVICFLYASSDEFHQTYVAGRSGEFRDVMLDSCGALFGAVFSKNVLNRFILNAFNAKI